MKKYWLLVVWHDVEPERLGPFESKEDRDNKAIELRREDKALNHGLYMLDTEDNVPVVTADPAGFLRMDPKDAKEEEEI